LTTFLKVVKIFVSDLTTFSKVVKIFSKIFLDLIFAMFFRLYRIFF